MKRTKSKLSKAEKLQRARARWEHKQEQAVVMLRRSAEELVTIRRQLKRLLQRETASYQETRRELAPPPAMSLSSSDVASDVTTPSDTTEVTELASTGGFGINLDDGLDIPPALDRNRKLQAMADPRSKEKKAEYRAVERERREADLTGKRRKMPLTGKAAIEHILGQAIYGKPAK